MIRFQSIFLQTTYSFKNIFTVIRDTETGELPSDVYISVIGSGDENK